ncbi:hypothetical protein CAC42_8135 [Sphaceloma murrayae]|uniref:Uncharacterized protein n=1 Tax=Sphaceloma murrayae TaxID=2082308 RepID=A0A2K1QRC3_9PEZI|nr:hypothetical protein CAC42_8135 [Sphaceloma murrayae]
MVDAKVAVRESGVTVNPRPVQEEECPVPATVHVAIRAVAAEEAATEVTPENETATLGESIALIANQPEQIPWFDQPCGLTPAERVMQDRRSSLTRPPFAPSPLRSSMNLSY